MKRLHRQAGGSGEDNARGTWLAVQSFGEKYLPANLRNIGQSSESVWPPA
jgi:hypothetical protein